MNLYSLSLSRLLAIIVKEFVQLKRDKLTFAMTVLIPLMQLVLFGYAINTNPKNLPTIVLAGDQSVFTRTFVHSLANTEYFKLRTDINDEKEAQRQLAIGNVQFVINIPPDFTHRFLRGMRPQIAVEADATDPVATASAIAAMSNLDKQVFNYLLVGSLASLRPTPPPIDLVMHTKYNPENITQYNIVPGLLGVVLTMSLVIIASMCVTREREHGTIENLLATPIKPLEVMIGKIVPHIIIGYTQFFLIMFFAIYVFHVPMFGNMILLILVTLPFIAANLSVGLAFSSMAKTQLQASQMAIFFFLPSILLSGFMFPFRGMPEWAQYVGGILPLTYYLRIVRGIILKGNDFPLVWPNLWPIIVFMVGAMLIGLKRYRQTLD